jgi:acetyl-CoA synthetase
VLFGEDALEFRLRDCAARAIVTDRDGVAKLERIKERLPALRHIFCVDHDTRGAVDFHAALGRASDRFEPVRTLAEEPALIIYTSGTTGNPKGALHAHRVLLGHLPGVEYPHNRFPQPGDRFWTPADWAWIGGLLDVLLPSWHHGIAVVAYRAAKFDPATALDLMVRHGIRNVFMPPTSLRLLRQSGAKRTDLKLRTVASGGESLGADVVEWGRETLGLRINEFYGQTECNLVLGNGEGLPEPRPGWTGTPLPGHMVRVVDHDGREVPHGPVGTIAIRRPDPVMFLGYWGNESASAAKFAKEWLLTGDQGIEDDCGYFRFVGRDDDLITSAGYRIGPGEVESCLSHHPAVAMAAVVGVPDPIRTELIKAVIVLAAGFEPTPQLAQDIQNFVRTRLAAHEYPRIIEFASQLPLTATGKVMRRLLRPS